MVGCSEIQISAIEKTLSSNGTLLKEGDWITLNGSTGNIYAGEIPLKVADLQTNIFFKKLMELVDKHRAMGVRTNADSPIEAKQALEFGAQGIGLCRTEHMFFNPERIMSIREMIIAENDEDRRKAIMKLLSHQKSDFYEILKTMAPYPVTIRLLDPPLHEFLPQENSQIQELAQALKMSRNKLDARIEHLHELNPMLGHRGCRLGISYPEITEMQARAIFEASAELIMEGTTPYPEVMVPLVGSVSEFIHQRKIIDAMANQAQEKNSASLAISSAVAQALGSSIMVPTK